MGQRADEHGVSHWNQIPTGRFHFYLFGRLRWDSDFKKWSKQARRSSLWQITVCLATVSESAGMPHTEGSHPEWEREPSEA